jgi:hypothetical protein
MTYIYIKIPQFVQFTDFPPSEMRVHFIPYRKDKIRTGREKIRMVVNTNTRTCFLIPLIHLRKVKKKEKFLYL